VVAILKDWFAVDSISIYLASVSSASPKHTITVLHRCDVSNIRQTETTSVFGPPYLFPVWRDTWRCEYYCHWKGHPWKHRCSSWKFFQHFCPHIFEKSHKSPCHNSKRFQIPPNCNIRVNSSTFTRGQQFVFCYCSLGGDIVISGGLYGGLCSAFLVCWSIKSALTAINE